MNKWISVEEELPKYEGRYLIMTKLKKVDLNSGRSLWPCNWQYPNNDINIAYYCLNSNWEYWEKEKIPEHLKVTHWMPLPILPCEKCIPSRYLTKDKKHICTRCAKEWSAEVDHLERIKKLNESIENCDPPYDPEELD